MPTNTARHVDQAAEAIRAANHTAFGTLSAPDTYPVVGALAELVHRLPQLLDYLARGLRHADPAEHYDDRGANPADALDLARADLDDVRTVMDDAGRRLNSAHNHLGHLGRRLSED